MNTSVKANNRMQAAKRYYGYTDKQIRALKDVYGINWDKLGKKALDAALYTMGLK